MNPPMLETTRLRLRPFGPDDVDALHAMWTEPSVRRYLWDDETISRERAAATVADGIASFAHPGCGMWVALRRADEAVVGFCGLRRTPEHAEPELVYGMTAACWGSGLATEAVIGVLRWAFEACALERVIGRTDPPNVGSMRVMENAGMTREPDSGDGLACYVAVRQSWRPGPT